MSGYRLFIGQLVRDVRRRELEDAFGKFGEIVRIDIKSGFGFIEYEHSRDAEDAIRKMDGEEFLGKRIIVEYARGRRRERDDRRDYRRDNRNNNGPERSENRLIVEGLARGTSWQDLKDSFRSVGDILFTDVRRDRYDEYYGIVELRYKDDIDVALRKMEGTEINGKKITLREDRKRRKSRSRSRSRSGEKRRRRSRSPRKRSSSPRKRSPSPRKRSQSPRKRSPSPRKRSPSPKRSESKERKRSPSNKRSPSPKRSSRSRSVETKIDEKKEDKSENIATEEKDHQKDGAERDN